MIGHLTLAFESRTILKSSIHYVQNNQRYRNSLRFPKYYNIAMNVGINFAYLNVRLSLLLLCNLGAILVAEFLVRCFFALEPT